MSKRAPGEETGNSSFSKSAERRYEDQSVASADCLTQPMPSNFVGDAVGPYQTTVPPHVTASHTIVNYVQGNQTIYNTHYHESSDRRDKIRQWLSPVIPSTNYDKALDLRVQETGKWIIKDKRFSEWKENANSLLWLYGKPGSGKTILSSVIIEDISLQCNGSATKAYGYFFFDGRDSQNGLQSLEHMLISLIWQFSERYNTLCKPLNDLYDTCGSGSRRPSMEILHNTLLLILHDVDHAYVILDALDESTERGELLEWIDAISRWKVGKLHLLTTSRPEPDIQKALRLLDPILICLEGEFVERDIMSYLDWKLQDDKNRKGWNDDTCVKIKTSLLKGAQGMFRWVALQLDELRRCRNRRKVEEQLGRLPKGLYESYDRIISRIDDGDREDAMKLFQWLAFSVCPLKLNELAEVVTVDFESRDLPWFDRDLRYDDVEGVLEVCSGFVSITEGEVKLAHFSVKEYLLSQSAPSFRISEKSSHLHISKTCLAYLAQFDGPDSLFDRDRLKDYPLAPYAGWNWISHAKAGDFDNTPLHQELVINIFRKPYILFNWTRLRDIGQFFANTHKSPDEIPPLYYASLAGFGVVVRALLETGADVNARGGRIGSPFHAASARGHEAVVKILLKNGADVNARGRRYRSALHAASCHGHEVIVKILLENGADVNAKGDALQGASYNGHEVIVKILLENGADVNAQGHALRAASTNGHEVIVKTLLENGADVNAQGGSALRVASLCGREAVVRILLENGADVNAQGDALQAASLNGHKVIVKILLENGADVNAQGGSALQAASLNGHEAIVMVLLEKDADVNAQGGEYGTALQAASTNNHRTIVKILLENGADVNAHGGKYGNALQAASLKGHKAIVMVLLEKDADVNAQGGEYGNALQAASSSCEEAIVRILLEHGADVNAQGGEYGNALQAASSNGHQTIAKILLEHGADVNAQGGVYGSALHAASSKGWETIVEILLENGADINAQRGEHGTALHSASSRGMFAIIKILLEKGTDINTQGGEYGTALQAAASNRRIMTAKMLLENGADVNAQGGKYGNALQASSLFCSEAFVRMLLENGADVNAQGGEYGTALQASSSSDKEAIVRILLEHGADVNIQGGVYGSALQAATSKGHKAIVEILLENGALVYDNALQAE